MEWYNELDEDAQRTVEFAGYVHSKRDVKDNRELRGLCRALWKFPSGGYTLDDLQEALESNLEPETKLSWKQAELAENIEAVAPEPA